ncbi:urease accessory protein UreD [Polycladidibacter hongkongensis]|uniref:urease accessory protein UreD n=1 Tax=Polycladidibacter hongkongensis TaxID=1647556 RepID=UPI000834922C|nr:urease accessory protein UreD [Pseudovibrio hongkongensis]
MQRTTGKGALSMRVRANGQADKTQLHSLWQEGAAKIRLPKSYSSMAEAVLINTSGGLTGGDRLHWQAEAGDRARLCLTTQACEKLYRASAGTAQVTSELKAGENAQLHWLPQETIVYNSSALERSLQVQLAASAVFVGVEAFVLGRVHMGEAVKTAHLHDRWRIYREGQLIHAEELRLAGDIEAIIKGEALLAGNTAFATLLYVGPEDSEQLSARAYAIRQELGLATADKQMQAQTAVCALPNKIIARTLAKDGFTLRQKLLPLIAALRPGLSLPKCWSL